MCAFTFRSLPEIDGLSKETVLTSWLAKFDCIMKGTGKFICFRYSWNEMDGIDGMVVLN